MTESFDEFKSRLSDLIRENKTEEAIEAINKRAKILEPKILNDILLLHASYNKIRRDDTLSFDEKSKLRNEFNRINDSILTIADQLDDQVKGKDVKGEVTQKALPVHKFLITHPRNLKIGTLIFIFILFIGIYYLNTSNKINKNCENIKKEAQLVLINLLEKRKTNKDQFDELRYIFLENELNKHIKLTSCDSVSKIEKDIQSAKQFLKSK